MQGRVFTALTTLTDPFVPRAARELTWALGPASSFAFGLSLPPMGRLRMMRVRRGEAMSGLGKFFLCGALVLPCAAGASSPPADSAHAGAVERKKPQKQAEKGRVVVHPGSGETPSQRAARLKRECKGLPNAAACTGYAQ